MLTQYIGFSKALKKKKLLPLSLVCFLLVGFGSAPPQEADPAVYYKRDIKITFEKKTYQGTAILPDRDEYHIQFQSPGKMDLITISSCHREFHAEEVGTRFTYTYKPIKGIEDLPACPLQINGYERNRGRHTSGYVVFQRRGLSLDATLKCNGRERALEGVGVCQSREGLIQQIRFKVAVSVQSNCEIKGQRDKKFEFAMPNRACQYLFKEKGGTRLLRLDTIGYEDILLRE